MLEFGHPQSGQSSTHFRLRVAVDSPIPSLFDYLAPGPLDPGCRVKVQFGHQRGILGVVTETVEVDAPLPPGVRSLRPVSSIVDTHPLVPPDVLGLIRFASQYWHHPIGEVAAMALPTRLRKGEPAKLIRIMAWVISDAGREALKNGPKGNALKRFEVLKILSDGRPHTRDSFIRLSSSWRDIIRRMKRAGLVESVELTSSKGGTGVDPGFTLTAEQAVAVDTIRGHLGDFRSILVDGSTGSGKTEVYLRVAREVIDAGQQALILVPEIGLTPQTIERFRSRFGEQEAVILHSGLTGKERADAWLRARAGLARIVVGTRSAVWTPMPDLGLIVVDEEHDRSYKQQDGGCHYNARDLAIFRARQRGVPVVLGTATPSAETFYHALQGHYDHVTLKERTGSAGKPKVKLVDMAGVKEAFAPPTIDAIASTLGRREQVLVFLNRRGFSPVLSCSECGHVHECPSCDHRMTVHQGRRRLECHWCGHYEKIPHRCGECGSPRLFKLGHGTERLDGILDKQFPDHPVLRFDSDTTRGRDAFERRMARARTGEPCILLGTQMLSKGHDLPNLTLVVVVDVDGALFSPEVRAQDFLAQTVTQVAGRAGRAELPGQVIVQTKVVGNEFLRTTLFEGYHTALNGLLDERRGARLPPYTHLALLHFSAPDPVECERFGRAAKAALPRIDGVRVSGPMPGIRTRVAGRWRHYFLVESANRKALHELLDRWLFQLRGIRRKRGLRWSVDVDPYEFS